MNKIKTFKKRCDDGTPFYVAHLNHVGGFGKTRHEAKTNAIDNIGDVLEHLRYDCREYSDENNHLKTQLAETEKKLDALTNVKANELGEAFSIIVKKLADTISGLDTTALLEMAAAYCQSKIDLMEQLRTLLDCEDYYCYVDNNINIVINRDNFNEIIDNQIKEIKGEQNEYNRN